MTTEEIAKEIVGKWGYEEEYWWKPIQEALDLAIQSKVKSIREEIDGFVKKTIKNEHVEEGGNIDAIGYLGDIRWKDMDNILNLPSLQLLDDNNE